MELHFYMALLEPTLKSGWWFGCHVFFPYIGNHHPNWRTHMFQRGGEKPPQPPSRISWGKQRFGKPIVFKIRMIYQWWWFRKPSELQFQPFQPSRPGHSGNAWCTAWRCPRAALFLRRRRQGGRPGKSWGRCGAGILEMPGMGGYPIAGWFWCHGKSMKI